MRYAIYPCEIVWRSENTAFCPVLIDIADSELRYSQSKKGCAVGSVWVESEEACRWSLIGGIIITMLCIKRFTCRAIITNSFTRRLNTVKSKKQYHEENDDCKADDNCFKV